MVHESSFCSMGPRIWNNLPETVVKTTSLSALKSQLKTVYLNVATNESNIYINGVLCKVYLESPTVSFTTCYINKLLLLLLLLLLSSIFIITTITAEYTIAINIICVPIPPLCGIPGISVT